jgi:LysM repeat protein
MADPPVAAGTSTSAFHRVRRGETLSELADEYGVTQRELQTWNRLDSRGRIWAGQRLRVKSPYAVRSVASTPEPSTQSGFRTHVVRRGETLKGLAKRYGVSIQALREANGLGEHDTLKTGVALRIPG